MRALGRKWKEMGERERKREREKVMRTERSNCTSEADKMVFWYNKIGSWNFLCIHTDNLRIHSLSDEQLPAMAVRGNAFWSDFQCHWHLMSGKSTGWPSCFTSREQTFQLILSTNTILFAFGRVFKLVCKIKHLHRFTVLPNDMFSVQMIRLLWVQHMANYSGVQMNPHWKRNPGNKTNTHFM